MCRKKFQETLPRDSWQLVIVKLMKATQRQRKWQVVKLLHCSLDRSTWEIQWYNSHDLECPMLDMKYFPAWSKPNNQEAYQLVPQAGWEPLQWNVYPRRFITPPFQLIRNKLPAHIRALIRAHPAGR